MSHIRVIIISNVAKNASKRAAIRVIQWIEPKLLIRPLYQTSARMQRGIVINDIPYAMHSRKRPTRRALLIVKLGDMA